MKKIQTIPKKPYVVNPASLEPFDFEKTRELILRSKAKNQIYFLSVIIRTQGKRIIGLSEALLSLLAQDCQDFEIIIVLHKVAKKKSDELYKLISELPYEFNKRITFLNVDFGNRTTPLNYGFAQARGSYISILDDDDVVFQHWVSTFKDMADKNFGKILRASTVVQKIVAKEMNGISIIRAVGGMERKYPSKFLLMDHLIENQTPPVSLSFPALLHQDLEIYFDESLNTQEDWDYLMRAASAVEIASCEEITSIYRWWENSESSRTLHSDIVWQNDYLKITNRLRTAFYKVRALEIYSQKGFIFKSRKVSSQELELLGIISGRVFKAIKYWTSFKKPLFSHKFLKKEDLDFLTPNEITEILSQLKKSRIYRVQKYLRTLLKNLRI